MAEKINLKKAIHDQLHPKPIAPQKEVVLRWEDLEDTFKEVIGTIDQLFAPIKKQLTEKTTEEQVADNKAFLGKVGILSRDLKLFVEDAKKIREEHVGKKGEIVEDDLGAYYKHMTAYLELGSNIVSVTTPTLTKIAYLTQTKEEKEVAAKTENPEME